MILEIARFFASAAHRRTGSPKGRYEITAVMGPDEYHYAYPGSNKPGINNNAYTNVMAVWVLQKAIEVLGLIPKSRREGLLERLQLRDEELKRWEMISRRMFVPFQDGGIISEFEGYDKLKELDWEGYRRKYGDIQNLDGILAAEGDSANNYKVSKQADVLMLFYLFSPEELAELFRRLGYHFDRETIPKNVEYYAKRTSHGSTLSRIVHAWILARLDRERSWSIAKEALESDLSDIQGGTSPEGIHLGAMAGTVEIIERCYVGLVTRNDVLWFDPCLPSELKNVLFTIFYRGHVFKLNLTAGTLEVTSSPGPAPTTRIGFRGRVLEIAPGQTKKFRIPKSSRWIGPV